MKKLIWLIILALVAWGIVALIDGRSTYTLVEEADAVLLLDQQPGDESVVSYAKLSQPGYVLVYGTDTTGQQVVLGASTLLSAGEHKNVRVRHRGGNLQSTTVTATIAHDDGDGTFDESTDMPATDESGEVVASEADVDAQADDVSDLSDEELAELLGDEGYNVNEDALDDEPTDDAMSDDDGSMVEDDGTMMEDDGTVMDEGDPVMEDDGSMSTSSDETTETGN